MHLKRVTLFPSRYPTRDYYPFSVPVLQHTRDITFEAPVTFFVGENGSGKSTLLEAVSHACGIYIWREPERTRVNQNPYEETFHKYLSVEWRDGKVPGSFFGSGIFRHFTQLVDEWAAADPGQLTYYGGKSLITQSHGESFLSFFRNRYRIKGLYLLDEPETALSPRSQLALLEILTETSEAGSAQFVIATHSPILLACPRALIYSFDYSPIKTVQYEETEHYRIYRDFIEDRTKYLKNGVR